MTCVRSHARFTCIGAALVVVAQLAGCATSTRVEPLALHLAPRAGPCEVKIIDKGGIAPTGHAAIARIESHIQRNLFFGGRVTLLDEAYGELRSKACEIGGDQVLVDDFMESAAGEMTHVHVWATVFGRN